MGTNEQLTGAWRIYSRAAGFAIGVLYAVGLVGHLMPATLPQVLFLTPGFLLVLGGMVLAPSFAANGWRFAFWAALAYVFTFLVEAAGVATGTIFGEYAYGPTLGWAWLDVPLIIGFNWVVTVNAAVCIACRIFTGEAGLRRNVAIVLTVGLLAMVFDWAMEPVAMRLDYWQWADGAVPLRNYAAWFATAALAAVLHPCVNQPACEWGTNGRLAGMFLLIQTGFFLLLRLAWHLGGG
jgi:putative membrane protein